MKDAYRSGADAMERQQLVLVGGEQFLERLVAGSVEGATSRSADAMRDLGHGLNLRPRRPFVVQLVMGGGAVGERLCICGEG
jgi:hypothetical protein